MQFLAWLPALRRLRRNGEAGQGGLEYALVAGVVVVAIIIAFNTFPIGEIVTDSLNQVKNLISGGGS